MLAVFQELSHKWLVAAELNTDYKTLLLSQKVLLNHIGLDDAVLFSNLDY